jgi:hypothetical protein
MTVGQARQGGFGRVDFLSILGEMVEITKY